MPKSSSKFSRSVQEFLKEHDVEETIKSSSRFKQWVKRKKEGGVIGILSLNQKRILKLLTKTKIGYTRSEISEKAKIHQPNVSLAVKSGTKKGNQIKGKESLIELKLVKQQVVTEKGREVNRVVITSKGLQVASKIEIA